MSDTAARHGALMGGRTPGEGAAVQVRVVRVRVTVMRVRVR